MSKKIKVQYVASRIGGDKSQRETLRCLGLKRLNQVRELPDNPSVRGMVGKLSHMVRIVEA